LAYALGRLGVVGAMPVTGDIATREALWAASPAAHRRLWFMILRVDAVRVPYTPVG
jgi:hypothetical protein